MQNLIQLTAKIALYIPRIRLIDLISDFYDPATILPVDTRACVRGSAEGSVS